MERVQFIKECLGSETSMVSDNLLEHNSEFQQTGGSFI
jgi:hypothetical protein